MKFFKNIKKINEKGVKISALKFNNFEGRYLKNKLGTVLISFHFRMQDIKILSHAKNKKKIYREVNYVHLALNCVKNLPVEKIRMFDFFFKPEGPFDDTHSLFQ